MGKRGCGAVAACCACRASGKIATLATKSARHVSARGANLRNGVVNESRFEACERSCIEIFLRGWASRLMSRAIVDESRADVCGKLTWKTRLRRIESRAGIVWYLILL